MLTKVKSVHYRYFVVAVTKQLGIHLLSVRFRVQFHVALDDLRCKQTHKVRTSVLSHIL